MDCFRREPILIIYLCAEAKAYPSMSQSQKKQLYVATTGGFQSYSIESNLSLTYQSNITSSSDCSNANHIAVSEVSPYTVFGVSYSTACPSLAISVGTNGALQSSWAEAAYSESTSSVHGGSVSRDGAFFYSADGKLLLLLSCIINSLQTLPHHYIR